MSVGLKHSHYWEQKPRVAGIGPAGKPWVRPRTTARPWPFWLDIHVGAPPEAFIPDTAAFEEDDDEIMTGLF